MGHPSPYSWIAAYESATSEIDSARLNIRIAEALTAIEERLDGPTKLDDAEHKEIQNALLALQMRSAQRSAG